MKEITDIPEVRALKVYKDFLTISNRKILASLLSKDADKPIPGIKLIPHLRGKAKLSINNDIINYCVNFGKSNPDLEKLYVA